MRMLIALAALVMATSALAQVTNGGERWGAVRRTAPRRADIHRQDDSAPSPHIVGGGEAAVPVFDDARRRSLRRAGSSCGHDSRNGRGLAADHSRARALRSRAGVGVGRFHHHPRGQQRSHDPSLAGLDLTLRSVLRFTGYQAVSRPAVQVLDGETAHAVVRRRSATAARHLHRRARQ